MKNCAVSAKAYQQIGISQLLCQIMQHNITRQFEALIHIERKADSGFNACFMEDFFRHICKSEISVPIRIRGHYNFFHNTSWAAATKAFTSGWVAPSGSIDKCPKNSIFPSGPFTGENVRFLTVSSNCAASARKDSRTSA